MIYFNIFKWYILIHLIYFDTLKSSHHQFKFPLSLYNGSLLFLSFRFLTYTDFLFIELFINWIMHLYSFVVYYILSAFCLVELFLDWFMLLHVSIVYSFLLLNSIPLCGYITIYQFSGWWTFTIFSRFSLLQINLWTFKPLWGCILLLLLSKK